MILLGVVLNAGAQLLMRQGMLKIGEISLVPRSLFPALPNIISSPYIILAILLYIVSVGVWLVVLSRVEVSVAYPMISIGYIIAVFLSAFLFHESVTLVRVAGVIVIGLGIVILYRS